MLLVKTHQLSKHLLTILLLLGASSAFAQGKAPATAPGEQPSKLDVSDLENKYWAAKDTDFNVVQNRLYSKAGRLSLSLLDGTLVNDPWTTGNIYGINLAYYFNERWGAEINYNGINSQDNQAVQRLAGQLGFPDHNQLKGFYGAQVDWVPFYAKMSVLNWTIIYFDLQFSLGGGMVNYQQQRNDNNNSVSTPAVSFDVTQNYFLNKTFAVRVDLKNIWYNEETVKYSGSHVSNGTSTSNATMLLVGLNLFY